MEKFTDSDVHRRLMYPVIYEDKLPDITTKIFNKESGNYNLATWISIHKLSDWKYEKEWRFIIQGILSDNANYLFPCISAIYMGVKIKEADKQKIIQLSSKLKFDVYQMKIAANEIIFELMK